MGLSGEEDDTERRYQEICRQLNMDRNAEEEAWQAFQRIGRNYTLEGDSLQWLACALYEACRKGVVPAVGRGFSPIEGNCVSLAAVLRACHLSLVEFFSKMRKWADMSNLSSPMRNKVERLERNFNVTTVIFKKYKPIFIDIFRNPDDDPQMPARSRKQKKLPCTPTEVFSFCWTLFIYVRSYFPLISDDLVNSFHLLLSCIDLMYSNVIMSDRRDLLNPRFKGLPADFYSRDYEIPTEPPCIVKYLTDTHQGIEVEAKQIKVHVFQIRITTLLREKKVLKAKVENFSGFLNLGNFEVNKKAVNREYESYVLNSGDLDERVFLDQNASEEIGTPANFCDNLEDRLAFRRHMEKTRSLAPPTPLSGQRFLKNRENLNISPVSTATQSVTRLLALLEGRPNSASDFLKQVFESCSRNPASSMENRLKEMNEIFCRCYSQPTDDYPSTSLDFAKRRFHLAEGLYYKCCDNIIQFDKKHSKDKNVDVTEPLEHDIFQKSLIACCLEIVLFSYNSQRTFPWVLEIFDLHSYDFYKVIELIIRSEEGLSRDVVKHLNLIEEQILECLAWKSDSPLWDCVKAGRIIPPNEDVELSNPVTPSTQHMSMLNIMSPLSTHPAIRRLTGNPEISPNTAARRRLFGPMSSEPATATGNTTTPLVTSLSTSSPEKANTLAIQTLQSDRRIACVLSSPTYALPGGSYTILSPVKGKEAGDNFPPPPPPGQPVQARPKKRSWHLFFRKVYHLAGIRLRDLCDRLQITDDELRKKIWTCFELSLRERTDLMRNRHLDQLIMCAVYVIAKVCRQEQNFQSIMRCYRLQPQAHSHVYRSVLLTTRERSNSGSSDNSRSGSGASSPSPVPSEDARIGESTVIRSSSTLPIAHPSSQPPTPTKLIGNGTQFEYETRGDLIAFYNQIYVAKMQRFAVRFQQGGNGDPLTLSPLPRLYTRTTSPRCCIAPKQTIFVSPLKASNVQQSPNRPLHYSFHKSPAKNLVAINNMVKKSEKQAAKRLLQDDSDGDNQPKKFCPAALRKLQNVLTDREQPQGDKEPPTI